MIDLGRVVRGEKRSYTIPFSNTGTENIEIDLISSCECTTVTWPEGEVIRPGGKSEISFVFDSAEKEESETVDIDVILKNTNSEGNPIFYILQYKFELIEP